ncbi:MAG: ATP-binding protein [Anaerolineales bacterium]|nr:ATP-binding protein [Anaerolineales bacterium]
MSSAVDESSVQRSRRLVEAMAKDELCPICGGAGFVVPDLPIGHPDFGKAVPCSCRQRERSQRRMRSLQGISALETLDRLTFENFIAEPSHLAPERAFNLRRAFETCRLFAQEPDGWLLLTGGYGSGKTHLAAAIANARVAMGEAALFLIVPDLLDHLRSAFGPQSEVAYDELFEMLRRAPLLILDDLGAHSSTPWAQEKLFQLLNHRYNTRAPTVITSNQRLDDLDPRLRSRLLDVELVTHCAITAPDFRSGKNSGQSELSSLGFHADQQFGTFDVQRSDITPAERSNLRDVLLACQTYVQDAHGWLVLAGENGCGKTHLAAAIANSFVRETRTDVMFVVVPDLLDHLRAAFSPQASTSYDRRFDEIRRAPLLVLDDLGTESATPWAREKLFQLLNYRYSALLPTVITTSAQPKQIEPWLRTRMLDINRCRWLAITAPGYRGSRSQQDANAPRTRRRIG